MATISRFDQMRQETAPPPIVIDAQGNELPAGSNGFGNVIGVLLIVGGALCLPISGGLSALAILAGCFAFGGEKITDNTCQDMHQAAAEQDPGGVNQAAKSGCLMLCGYVFVGVALLFALFMALAAAGMIAGVTL